MTADGEPLTQPFKMADLDSFFSKKGKTRAWMQVACCVVLPVKEVGGRTSKSSGGGLKLYLQRHSEPTHTGPH